jgi:serine protease Do
MAWSVTKGIISNNERFARHPYIHAIQTDASINKGNSGGPLMNMQGEIIGINTAIISHIGQSAGVGLAIRGDIVKKSLESMLQIGKVIRPAIGVHIMPLGHPRQRKLVVKEYPKLKDSHIPNVSGMFVSEPSGTELPEGVKKFDTIIAIDGKPFNNGIEFSDILSEHEVGDEVILTIIRKRRYILVKVELKELPIDVEKMYPSNVTMIPNDKNNEK